MSIPPFPLAWPEGMPRTQGKATSRFKTSLSASGPVTKAVVQDAHRLAASKAHPDKGGSAEAMAAVNAARDAALAEVA